MRLGSVMALLSGPRADAIASIRRTSWRSWSRKAMNAS
jgi:hypothetical protein